MENLGGLHNSVADVPLAALLRQCLEQDLFVVGEGETSTLGAGGPGLIGTIRSGRAGIALAPATEDGLSVMRTAFPPRLSRADFPPGRGLYVAGGRTAVVQVALPEEQPAGWGTVPVPDRLERAGSPLTP